MTTTIMAVDPGKWTGISWCRIERGWTRDEVARSWREGTGGTKEVTGPTEDHRAWAIIEAMAEIEPDVMVMEHFVEIPGRKFNSDGSGTEPMRLEAKVNFMLWLCSLEGPFTDDQEFAELSIASLPEVVEQGPGERVGITVAVIKELGLYTGNSGQGGGKDSLAATQHLLTYVRKVNESRRKAKR